MNKQEKIKLIYDNQEAVIKAITVYLDKIYELSDKFFDENEILKEGLQNDEKLEEFILKLKNKQAPKYEDVRHKLINNDFNLSSKEIAYINSALIYIFGCWETQIKKLTTAKEEIAELIKSIREQEN